MQPSLELVWFEQLVVLAQAELPSKNADTAIIAIRGIIFRLLRNISCRFFILSARLRGLPSDFRSGTLQAIILATLSQYLIGTYRQNAGTRTLRFCSRTNSTFSLRFVPVSLESTMSHPVDPQDGESVTGTQRPLVPVSAEDFARRKRRVVSIWVGAGLLVLLIALWVYRSSVNPLEAQQALEEGKRFLKANRYPEAVLSFSHALALRSDLADAYLFRGRANAGLGRLDLAVQDFSKVIQLRPDGA